MAEGSSSNTRPEESPPLTREVSDFLRDTCEKTRELNKRVAEEGEMRSERSVRDSPRRMTRSQQSESDRKNMKFFAGEAVRAIQELMETTIQTEEKISARGEGTSFHGQEERRRSGVQRRDHVGRVLRDSGVGYSIGSQELRLPQEEVGDPGQDT